MNRPTNSDKQDRQTDSDEKAIPPGNRLSTGGEEAIPVVPWEELSQGSNQLHIAFHGQLYHLRVTRNGKLIMTK